MATEWPLKMSLLASANIYKQKRVRCLGCVLLYADSASAYCEETGSRRLRRPAVTRPKAPRVDVAHAGPEGRARAAYRRGAGSWSEGEQRGHGLAIFAKTSGAVTRALPLAH